MIWRTDLSYLINVPQQALFRAQAKEGQAADFGGRRCFNALKCDRIGDGATLTRR